MTAVNLGDGNVQFLPTPDRGVEIVINTPPPEAVRYRSIGHVDMDFAVATGGGPRPVWMLYTPGVHGFTPYPTMLDALFYAVEDFLRKHAGRDTFFLCLSGILADRDKRSTLPYEEAMGLAFKNACLYRLQKAYDLCLHVSVMGEIDSVRTNAIAKSVMRT